MNLHLDRLSYCLNNKISLIHDISFNCTAGQLYGILGPIGSGKSTLLKAIARVWEPTAGSVYWQKTNLMTLSRRQVSKIISLVPQNPSIYFDWSAYQMVAMGCYFECKQNQAAVIIQDALMQVNAWHLRNRALSQLSGGERQLIYLARAIATQAPIILLDEPTAHLDLHHQLTIWNLLTSLVAKEGKILLVATHDLTAAKRFCDHLIIIKNGICELTGESATTLTDECLKNIFGARYDDNQRYFEII